MTHVLLIQLPIPQLNFGKQTGNIPLAAACLKQVAEGIPDVAVDILAESIASYLGDAALIQLILSMRPDIIGFSVYSWNVERSLYIVDQLIAHYRPKIIFGGPEITPDNPLIHVPQVDFWVYGEGEAVFRKLLQDQKFWENKCASESVGTTFSTSPSPYLRNMLEPEIENMMLLETQRGCPYRCAFCYYNKSRINQSFVDDDTVLDSIRWAIESSIGELYLLDPSLNIRPGLKSLLKKIRTANPDGRLAIFSEIRAEAVDEDLADLFVEAGFTWFEIGLQSTNPQALKMMNRPTHLKRFLGGAKRLKNRGILPQIDLIVGLPGDDLDGFGKSVDFAARHELCDDIQVFPLSILPGTDFRRRRHELGLCFEPHPPYTVIKSPTFSNDDMLLAFDYAEVRFDAVFHPMPDLDIAWRLDAGKQGAKLVDHMVVLGKDHYISKIFINSARSLSQIEKLAQNLSHPYQIFILADVCDHDHIRSAMEVLTSANPFTPCELIFLEPESLPKTTSLLSAVKLRRPHYLDTEQRFLFPSPGNRAVLFTLVSERSRYRFGGEMQRQVYWWKHALLPQRADLDGLSHLDGVVIDSKVPELALRDWQERFAKCADEIPAICFAQVSTQKRWLLLTAADEYAEKILNLEKPND